MNKVNKVVITVIEGDGVGADIQLEYEGKRNSTAFALGQIAMFVMKEAIKESGANVQTTMHEHYVGRAEETTH